MITLSGPGRESVFPAHSPVIRVNRKLRELYFLHACMYAEKADEPLPLIQYRIHYEDGTEHVFICYRGQEVDDWWDPPKRMTRAIRTYQEHPESARINMLKGAEIILTPNVCNLSPILLDQFRVRAYENAVVTAMANYSGAGADPFNGHSCVFNVDGRELQMAGEEEGVFLAEIGLGTIRDFRERTIYGNAFRRPHKYRSLVGTGVDPPFIRNNALGESFNRLER